MSVKEFVGDEERRDVGIDLLSIGEERMPIQELFRRGGSVANTYTWRSVACAEDSYTEDVC